MSLENVKVKDLNKMTYVKLKDLYNINPSMVVKTDVLKKYARIVHINKKQPQATKHGAGMNRVAIAAGTNKGRSRMPYANFGYKTIKTNVPGTVKGRKALRFMMNQKSLKCNKKEKNLAIMSLLLLTLKNAKLYLVDDQYLSHLTKTSDKIRFLRDKVDLKFKSYLVEPKVKNQKRSKLGPCIFTEKNAVVNGLFRNYPNVLYLNEKSNRFYDLYKGATTRSVVLFDKSTLEHLLKRFNLLNLTEIVSGVKTSLEDTIIS